MRLPQWTKQKSASRLHGLFFLLQEDDLRILIIGYMLAYGTFMACEIRIVA